MQDDPGPQISPKTVLYVVAATVIIVAAMCSGVTLAIFT